jgi:hypothetical protein
MNNNTHILHIINLMRTDLKNISNISNNINELQKIDKKLVGYFDEYLVSEELKEFMKTEKNKIQISEILDYLLKYIETNHLISVKNPKIIIKNEELKKLFRLNEEIELTYLILQKLIKIHLL